MRGFIWGMGLFVLLTIFALLPEPIGNPVTVEDLHVSWVRSSQRNGMELVIVAYIAWGVGWLAWSILSARKRKEKAE